MTYKHEGIEPLYQNSPAAARGEACRRRGISTGADRGPVANGRGSGAPALLVATVDLRSRSAPALAPLTAYQWFVLVAAFVVVFGAAGAWSWFVTAAT